MKRIGNLYGNVCSMENLVLAEKKARKGKLKQLGVQLFAQNRKEYFGKLQQMLLDHSYRTSKYIMFKVYEPKER